MQQSHKNKARSSISRAWDETSNKPSHETLIVGRRYTYSKRPNCNDHTRKSQIPIITAPKMKTYPHKPCYKCLASGVKAGGASAFHNKVCKAFNNLEILK
ncbi:hypothetical protein M758_10G104000 [Ceratodon purpureus]|nr:hypothetical protein M758_10G104000 [Ceratodon purpureus]